MPSRRGSRWLTSCAVECSGCDADLLGLRGFARIRNPPNRAVGVLGNEQGPVIADSHADWAAPDLRVADREASRKVVVFSGRYAILHNHADDFISGPFRTVPRAVFCGKNVAAVFRRELGCV